VGRFPQLFSGFEAHLQQRAAELLNRTRAELESHTSSQLKYPKKAKNFCAGLDEAGVRLGKLAATAESTLEKSLLKLAGETLEHLQKEIDGRIDHSSSQLESALAKAMESFCGALRDPD